MTSQETYFWDLEFSEPVSYDITLSFEVDQIINLNITNF